MELEYVVTFVNQAHKKKKKKKKKTHIGLK